MPILIPNNPFGKCSNHCLFSYILPQIPKTPQLPAVSLPIPDKSCNRAVIGLLGCCGEITGWQFIAPPMIGNTFTANSFPAARFIRAITSLAIDSFFTLHGSTPGN